MAHPVYANPLAKKDWVYTPTELEQATDRLVLEFHKLLPTYNQTPLRSLPTLAASLGISHLLLKDESNRFGLPAFKILGASWAVYRSLVARLAIPLDPLPSLSDVGAKARAADVVLVTCTEGNWGRAVARMAGYLGVGARIFVPGYMVEETRGRIRGEGAEVIVVKGSYDDSVVSAKADVEKSGGILVVDFGWEGYEEMPQVSSSTGLTLRAPVWN